MGEGRAKALLIDYGGVLYYEEVPITSCSNPRENHVIGEIVRYLRGVGAAEVSPESVATAIRGWSLEGPVEQSIGYAAAVVLSAHGIRLRPAVVRGLETLLKSLVTLNSKPLPWARRVLEFAKDFGLYTALVSNHWCHECVVESLERDGLADLLDAVVTSDLVGYCKPDPRIFEAALKLLGVDAGSALFVDDNERNLDGGVKAGLMGVYRFDRSLGEEAVEGLIEFIKEHV